MNNYSSMFESHRSLKEVYIYNWDTSNITSMSNMFYNCSSLISLPDISKWNTKNVTNMSGIFI